MAHSPKRNRVIKVTSARAIRVQKAEHEDLPQVKVGDPLIVHGAHPSDPVYVVLKNIYGRDVLKNIYGRDSKHMEFDKPARYKVPAPEVGHLKAPKRAEIRKKPPFEVGLKHAKRVGYKKKLSALHAQETRDAEVDEQLLVGVVVGEPASDVVAERASDPVTVGPPSGDVTPDQVAAAARIRMESDAKSGNKTADWIAKLAGKA